jgi:5-methylcytosine-specific restriction protein A
VLKNIISLAASRALFMSWGMWEKRADKLGAGSWRDNEVRNTALKKLCNHQGCYELIDLGQRFCEKHQQEGEKQKADSNRYYDGCLRNQRSREFYKSRSWQAARRRALTRDHYLCQKCIKEGRITQADTVHHRVEISKDWSKRLNMDNLVSLCASCHNRVHAKG